MNAPQNTEKTPKGYTHSYAWKGSKATAADNRCYLTLAVAKDVAKGLRQNYGDIIVKIVPLF